MRKLFILISILALSIAAFASPIPAGAGALSSTIGAAEANAVIELGTGDFTESSAITLDKNLVIKAAEGASPVIKSKGFGIQNGARVTFIGIKFDASTLESGDYHLFYANSADDNNRLILESCEIYDFANNSSVINCNSAMNLDSLIVNDCYIHDIKKSFLFQQGNSLKGLTVKNSTFAHVTTVASSYYANIIHPESNVVKVLVDHCTFYDCNGMASDYGSLKVPYSSDVVVSNSIFAQPNSYAGRAIITTGTVTNCLLHNFTKGTKGIHTDSPWNVVTITECSDADPQFTDAAHNDFSYPGNYVTMNISPARSAGTDGSDLGAPLWYTASTLPSTNFASAYYLVGTKALFSDHVGLNGNNNIAYDGNEATETSTATWKIHVEKACAITALTDMEDGNTSGCTLRLMAFNAAGEFLDSIAAPFHNKAIDLNFSGCLYFPAAGDYTLKLYNRTKWSSSKIEKIVLSYAGGAVQDIPATIGVGEAWYGVGGTRASNQIYFSSWKTDSSYVKWNIKPTDNLYCNVKVSISTDNAHQVKVAVVEKGKTDTIKFGESWTNETEEVTRVLNLGRIYLLGGKKFEVKVINPVSGSHVKINNVQFEEIAVSTINIPAATSLLPANAMLSDSAGVVSGSPDYINFKVRGSHKYNDTEWARWKINVTEMSSYIFTANVQSPENNGQYYTISVLSIDESETKGEKVGSSDLGDGDRTFATDPITLPVGEYIVKIVNPYPWSQGCVKSISVAQATPVTISENDADIEAVIGANNGKTVDAQLTRTLVAGMYNTICLPFAVSAAEMGRVFPGAVVKELTSSSVEEGDFVLNLNFSAVSEMEAGVPYIIKPAADVANPKFIGVTIDKTLNPVNTTNADFVGNFVAGTIPASENNLFLGANNTLYFPTVDMPILGMRAYFVIHDAPAGAVKRARIIEREQIITDVELVAEQPNAKSQKILRNGQLIIIRDGNMYNVMGAKLQ